MNEPLTEKTLKRWRGYSLYSAQFQAASQINDLKAENAKLRKYIYHNQDCALLNDSEERGGIGIAPCTCGLDDVWYAGVESDSSVTENTQPERPQPQGVVYPPDTLKVLSMMDVCIRSDNSGEWYDEKTGITHTIPVELARLLCDLLNTAKDNDGQPTDE